MKKLTYSIGPDIAVRDRAMSIGGKMLDGYKSPITATIVKRLESAGIKLVADKADFAITTDTTDASSYQYRFRPTYGAVSRYGIAARGSSIDTANIATNDPAVIASVLELIAGQDENDSISFNLEKNMITKPRVGSVNLPISTVAHVALEVIYSAETASNFYRYDGIRYGFRAKDAKNLVSLYGDSRDQGLSTDDKRTILFGTYVLGADNYDRYFVQAQKVRTLIIKSLDDAFENLDILTVDDPSAAVLAGLPVLATPSGKHLVGRRGSDYALLKYAGENHV